MKRSIIPSFQLSEKGTYHLLLTFQCSEIFLSVYVCVLPTQLRRQACGYSSQSIINALNKVSYLDLANQFESLVVGGGASVAIQ